MLTLLFAVASPLLTLLLYFTLFPEISPLWMLPIAIGGFLGFCLLHILFRVVSGLLLSTQPPERYMPFARRVLILTVDWVLALLRVRVRVTGKDLLPKEPFILISNHRSAMDALTALRAFRGREMSFISKASVMRWPIVGPYMLQSGFLAIERDKPLQSLRVINRAAKLVKAGMDFGIFPEGTRTKDGRVGVFKEGAFLAAKKAGAPIVIVTTEGTENMWKRLSPSVRVTVREIIDADTVKELSHEELSRRSRAIICRALKEQE